MGVLIFYADLPGIRVNENPASTIPDEILVTSARPDIVLIGKIRVKLIELTVFHNSLRVFQMSDIVNHRKRHICTGCRLL